MIYGYARVSMDGQSVAAQVKQLRDGGAEKIARETASGAQSDRAALSGRGGGRRERPLPARPRHSPPGAKPFTGARAETIVFGAPITRPTVGARRPRP